MFGREHMTVEQRQADTAFAVHLGVNLLVLVLLCATGLIILWLLVAGWRAGVRQHRREGGDIVWFWFW